MGVKSFFHAGNRPEITGFLLIVLAIFLLLSLASYHQGDIEQFTPAEPAAPASVGEDPDYLISEGDYRDELEIAAQQEQAQAQGEQSLVNEELPEPRSLSFSELLDVRVENAAGIVGAFVAEYTLRGVGRSAFILTFVLILIGWKMLFGYQTSWIRNKMLVVFAFVFVLGTLLHLLDLSNTHIAETLTVSLSGALGLSIAQVIKSLFAVAGGFAILGATLIFLFFAIVPFRPGTIRKGLDTGVSVAGRSSKTAVFHLKEQSRTWMGSLRELIKRPPKAIEPELEPEVHPAQPVAEEAIPVYEVPVTPPPPRKEPEQLPLRLEDQAEKRKIKIVRATRVSKDGFLMPPLDLLQMPPLGEPSESVMDLYDTGAALLQTLTTFGVEYVPNSLEKFPGPIITRFEFKPAPGIKINQIVNLADDLALALKASRIRIIAPVPGKSAVGVEIPNRKAQKVYLREIINSDAFQRSKYKLPLALGKTTMGAPYVVDLARMPHLLIAGATGSGKSVCLNAVITSLLYRHTPKTLRFIFIDPKILELSIYADIPFLARPVVTKPKMAESVLAGAVNEMEERYRRLATQSVRSLDDYNAKVEDAEKLPYLLIVVDELADMMMSPSASKIELLITRLAQMARAVGIHLILATQRPSVDVITGLIKANFSSRIAFQVASKVDSRTILDSNGAEKLLGQGDMLLLLAGEPEPLRVHGAYVSSEETEAIVGFLKENAGDSKPMDAFSEDAEKAIVERNNNDVLLPEAAELVIRHKQGSVSLLQRRLGIGYQRAARIMDQLEAAGVVGPYDGSKAREILVDRSYLDQLKKDKPSV